MKVVLTCLVAALISTAVQDSPNVTTQKQPLRVALCQTFCIDSDADGNLRRIEYAVEQASRQGAALACFPESSILGWINPDAHKLAQPIPGPITQRLGALATKYNLMVCIGMDEKDGDKLYDSAVLIGIDGKILAKHRKINNLSEAKLMDPPYTDGNPADIQVVETPIGRVGLLICADTFVGQLLDRMADKRPDVLLVPYGWAADKHQWPGHGEELKKVVCRAAKQVGCPVVGTDCVGMISRGPWAGKTYGGQSLVADRDGKSLGVLRDRDAEVRVFEIRTGRGN